MVGIVIVSHSKKLAEGVADLTEMMAQGCPLAIAGGMENGGYGTSYEKIMRAVESVYSEDGVAILFDMGSAAMTTEMVLEDLPYENVRMLDCPIAEGAVAATVASVGGLSLREVEEAAVSTKGAVKF
ncbi:MAG TPA: PTS-dependent dihydroxyacetone kinase phosphotransferase subunit DhaM [Candidatus Mediterraneibacter pullicola]|uniref:phosphoenolpyruvate--glycerone phosphotransferase n=1 Tax=Candidatus Mediterraneibacter pullicola TaxID=2838682 RepID=A0A9D2HCD6_9FIRM|nr:PTS-dependent dihydroxyacetone kinase phosphotransferase subunit DhaM [Candidatus Mediterraneibacter pullicola]